MLRSYTPISTDHAKLNYFIIGFFNRIEFETGKFDDSFFGDEFLKIVDRHPSILKAPCKLIYSEIKDWPQHRKTKLCDEIRKSNDIINICQGGFVPRALKAPTKRSKRAKPSSGSYKYADILEVLRVLFIKLYEQVIDGSAFKEVYSTNLRSHFDEFRSVNEDITLCPICGISELKTKFDKSRDQYDHYLPKALYPFSSVNFDNLVPTCKECNGPDVKGDKDIVGDYSGKLFYPYDLDHKGINIDITICRDDPELDNIEWDINYTNPDLKNDEVESWKGIYNIDDRYKGFIKGRIKKWFECYWTYINDGQLSHLSLADRELTCMKALDIDEALELSFLRKPALSAFLSGSPMAKAQIEARLYS